jgi:hypothetical protein
MNPTTEQIAAEIYVRLVTELVKGRSTRDTTIEPKASRKLALFALEAASAFAEASTEYQSQDKPKE